MDPENKKSRPIPKGRARKQDNASREARPTDRTETDQRSAGLPPDLETLRRETQERERAEAALRRAERDYRHLVESAHDAIIIFRPEDEVVLEVNQRACELYGFERSEFIGMSLEKITHDVPRGKMQIQATLDQGFYHHLESVHYRKDGTRMFVEINGSRVNYQGRWAIQSINRDITERKQAEEKLLSQYSTLQAIIGSADALIFSLDRDYRYTSFNQNHAAMMKALYGVDIEIGRSLLDYMKAEEDRKGAKGNLDRALQGESVVESSYSGDEEFSRRYFEVSHNPIRTMGGEIIGVAVLAKDQTERKRAEEALRESEEKYRLLVENSQQGILVLQDGKLQYANPRAVQHSGYSLPELTSRPFLELVHPEDRAMVGDRYTKRLKGEEIPEIYQFRFLNKQGRVQWVEVNSVYITWKGRPAALSFLSDITERKRAEEALRDSESHYRALVEQSLQGILIAQGFPPRIVFANPAIAEILGYSLDELTSLSPEEIWRLLSPEDQPLFEKRYRDRTAGRSVSPRYECRLLRKDDSVCWVDLLISPTTYQGAPAFQVVCMDITGRKRAEEVMREAKETFETLLKASPEAVMVTDLEGTITFASPRTVGLHGFSSPEEMVGRKGFELIPPEEHGKAREGIQKLLRGETLVKENFTGLRKDGSRFDVEINTAVLRDAQGAPKAFITSARDVTERQRAEDAVRQSEARYRLLAENVTDLIWMMDLSMRFTYLSPSVTRLTGYSVEEALSLSLKETLTPPSFQVAMQTFSEEMALESSGRADPARSRVLELEQRCKDGSAVAIEVTTTFLRDSQGRPVGILGVSRDITARKRAEEALRLQRTYFRRLFDSSPEGILLHDDSDTIIDCNQGFQHLFQYSREEVVGRKTNDLIVPEDRHGEATGLSLQAWEKGMVQSETVRKRKDGSLVPVSILGVTIKLDENKIGIYAIYRDITDQKLTEQALRASEERFRSLFEQMVIGMYRTTPDGRILMANPALLRMLGYASFQELSRNNLETMGFETTYTRAEFKERMERDGQAFGLEFAWRKRDGTVLYVRESARVIRDTEGHVLYYEGTAEDITEHKQAEQALRESESRNRAILDALPDLMFIQNADGVYLDYHASDPGLLFVPPEIFLGKNMREVLPPELSARFAKLFELLWETGVTQVLEYPLRLSGEARFFEARIAAFGPDRVLSLVRDITARKQAESALQQHEREVSTLLDSLPAYAYFKRAGSVYVAANRKFCEAVGCPQSKIAGKSDYDLFPRELAEKYRTDDARMVIAGETLWVGEEEMVDRGRRFVVETRKVPVKDEKGTVVGLIGLGFDITERKELEEQLLQSQKMEAVGRLAGGVAHDFNNILTAIMGYSDVLLEKLPPEDPLRRFPEGILETVDRASNLTNQLLAFSRRQDVQPEVLSLNDVVADMERMLRRLIGEDVELISDLEPALGPVKADPVQLEQVLLNLVVNARDAMSPGAGGPGGGRLTIKTSNEELDADYVRRHVGLEPGPYVLLSVTDTGRGMVPEVLAHLFEPFFTTKDKGKGTGLGLSTVYGLVKQTGGHIEVESAPGAGATFRVFLPRHTVGPGGRGEEASRSPVPEAEPVRTLQGTETILVVEDDEGVRRRACEILQGYGYVVREAGHGEEALAVAKEHPGPIHLLVADVVMPQVSGPELARRLAPSRLEMKVLFISGYTDGELAPYGVLKEGTSLLRKPFKPEALARRVRALLDAP